MSASSASATRSVSFSRAASAAACCSAGISSRCSPSDSWWYAFMRMMSTTPLKAASAPIGIWTAPTRWPNCCVELGHDRVEVGVLLVHAVDEDGARDAHVAGYLPQSLGLHLGPANRVDDEERHLGGFHARDGVADEVGETGRVDDVDLDALVRDGCEREVDRELPLDLFGVVVEVGMAVVDGAEALGLAGHEEHRLGEGRLARASMADQNDVTDLLGAESSHLASPPRKFAVVPQVPRCARRGSGRSNVRGRPNDVTTPDDRNPTQ